jgi:ligand-binding sensor domain-containing protein
MNRLTMFIIVVVLFVLWSCFPIFLTAQPHLLFSRLSLEDGLSQSSVQSILQDKEGLIWIGTQNGLNRYDGRQFVVYQNNPYDPYSIMNNMILSLCEDNHGNIWIGTLGGGLIRFEKRSNRFFSLLSDSTFSALYNENVIWALFYDEKEDILWIGGSSKLLMYHMAEGVLEDFSAPGNPMELSVFQSFLCILKDADGSLWFGTNGSGLAWYNQSSHQVTWFRNDPANINSISNDIVWSLMQDHNGKIWIGTNDGVNILDPATGSFEHIKIESDVYQGLTDNTIWSLLEDRNRQIWIGTHNGLHLLDTVNHRFNVYRNIPYDTKSLSNNIIWTIFQGQSGTLWVGTNQGISLFSPSRLKFLLYRHDPDQKYSLPEEPVSAICEDSKGRVWVGTDGGGLAMLQQDGSFTVWKNNPADPASISGNKIWSVVEDRAGTLWIGTYGGGLCKMNPSTGWFTVFMPVEGDPPTLSNLRVLVIHEDHEGFLWLGTRGGGLCRMDKNSGKFQRFLHDPSDSLSIPVNVVTSILEDSRKNLWVGTFAGGLCMIDREKGVFRYFQDTLGARVLGDGTDVWTILEDNQGAIWAGTSAGLFRLNSIDTQKGIIQVVHLTTADGLPGNTILGLMEDEESVIWITTFNGISRLDPSKLEFRPGSNQPVIATDAFNPPFRNYEVADGLQSKEFYQGAYHKGRSGKLYAGGIHGLNIIDPQMIREDPFQPQVIFTGLKLFYKDILIRPEMFDLSENERNGDMKVVEITGDHDSYYIPYAITYANGIILDHRMNVFTIDFASLDYYNPSRIQYACMLQGFEKDWNMLGNANSVTYTNMDPGEYEFRLKATNADRVWKEESTTLKVIVTPPFWRTFWFIALAIILTLGILGSLIYLIIRRQQIILRRKAEHEREIAELRLKTIKSQIDPHFTFNAINAIGSFIYKESPDVTYDYFGKFSKLIRETLQNTDKIYIPLAEEIEFVRTYLELEKIRFKEKFNFTITMDDAIDLKVLIPKMIVQTYAENAIKHGLMHRPSGGLLDIRVALRNNILEFTITDNGIGRQKAAELAPIGTKRGLRIINQFYEIHNKLHKEKITHRITDLRDESGQPTGTLVTICYPLVSDPENY